MKAEDRSGFDPDEPAVPSIDRFALRTGVAHAVVFALMFGVLIRGGAQFEKIFRDFDTTLPAAAQMALMLSHWFASYWFIALGSWIVGVVAVVAFDRNGDHTIARFMSYGVLLGSIAILGLWTIAMFMPFMVLIQKLD